VTSHRFFIPLDLIDGESVAFPPDASRQMERVLRLQPGDIVTALDGSGLELTVRLQQTRGRAVGQSKNAARTTPSPKPESSSIRVC